MVMKLKVGMALVAVSVLFSAIANPQSEEEPFGIIYQGVVVEELPLSGKLQETEDLPLPDKVQYLIVLNLTSGDWPDHINDTEQKIHQIFKRIAEEKLYGTQVESEFQGRRVKNADTEQLKKELDADGYFFYMRYPSKSADWNWTTDFYIKEFLPDGEDDSNCLVRLKSSPTINERGWIKLNTTYEVCESTQKNAIGRETESGNDSLYDLIAPADSTDDIDERTTQTVKKPVTSPASLSAGVAAKGNPALDSETEKQVSTVLELLNGKDGTKVWKLTRKDKTRIALGITELVKSIKFPWFGETEELLLLVRGRSTKPLDVIEWD